METYQKEYDEFIENYKNAEPINGESIGLFICKLVQHFSGSNLAYGNAKIAYNRVAKESSDGVDENTGKTVSMAKATVVTDATTQASTLILTKIEVENLQEMINAMKSLQKGAINDYQHQGLT